MVTKITMDMFLNSFKTTINYKNKWPASRMDIGLQGIDLSIKNPARIELGLSCSNYKLKLIVSTQTKQIVSTCCRFKET